MLRDRSGILLLAAALAAFPGAGRAPAQERETFGDKFRDFIGTDSGKKRIARETLVRNPEGGFSRQTPAGLQPHPCSADWRAAEELFQGKQYGRAAKLYKSLAKRHEGTAVEEDALFQEAECYFHDGYWPAAADAYHKLMKDFPTTRHLRPAVQRSYDIAADWLEDSRLRAQGQPGRYEWHNRSMNFSDRRRPLLDTPGRALQIIERLQTYDPAGPLTGSATMLAGAQSFTTGNYVKAAGYYEQLVVERPKDEYAGKAALLAAQAYLRSYQGPGYDGSDLLKAEELTQRALRLPGVTDEQKQRLEEDLRKIFLLRAERDYHTAEVLLAQRKPSGAKFYFDRVAREYADTAWAARAKEELAKLQPVLAALPPPKPVADPALPSKGMFAGLPNPLRRLRGEPANAAPAMSAANASPDAAPPPAALPGRLDDAALRNAAALPRGQ